MKKIATGIAICLASNVAYATNYERICHACNPANGNDNAVRNILQPFVNKQNGTTITIQTDQLKEGRYYAYAKWKKGESAFTVEETGDRQLADSGGEGPPPPPGSPGGGIPPGGGGNYGGGCIGNCGPAQGTVTVGPIGNP